jgi:hypothetical protein
LANQVAPAKTSCTNKMAAAIHASR